MMTAGHAHTLGSHAVLPPTWPSAQEHLDRIYNGIRFQFTATFTIQTMQPKDCGHTVQYIVRAIYSNVNGKTVQSLPFDMLNATYEYGKVNRFFVAVVIVE